MTRNDVFIEERLGQNDSVWNRLKYDRDGIIEASAGTGKTYALQSIVLKLVSSKDNPVDVKNILLVTYTEKAAGELKDRIRAILDEAGVLPADFDETTICTIHSFCRELLSEYAFENRVPMQIDVGGSVGELVHRAVREAILGDDFKIRYEKAYGEFMAVAEKETVAQFEKRKIDTTDDLVSAAEKILLEHAKLDEPPPEPPRTDDPSGEGQNDIARLQLQRELAYLAWGTYRRLKEDSSIMTFDDLVTQAYRVVKGEAERETAGERSSLMDSIRRRYRIALVDEFQDTDEKQWAIFGNIFSSRVNRLDGDGVPNPKQGFLLVVGDPKQAIYGFRGADIKTYLSAKHAITDGNGTQPPQTLAATFRSSKPLVDAFNRMFGNDSGWFGDMAEDGAKIVYYDVTYPDGNERFLGMEDFTGRESVTLLESLPQGLPTSVNGNAGYGNATKCLPVFMANAAAEMKRLRGLDTAYRTTDPKTGKSIDHQIRYGDMCVLVRDTAGAKIVKSVLSEHGIPYSHYKERGIYESVEAEALIALFDFLSEPGRPGNLAALLLTPLFGIHPSELEAKTVDGGKAFSDLLERWQDLSAKRDWNTLFESVMDDTMLAHPRKGDYGFDRRWTASRQMLDRLLAEKGRSALVPGEFAALLRTWRKDDQSAGEDGALRQRENESDSVQIMTMHASKGLEFKAVFVASGFAAPKRDGSPNEERRLYYVALTRSEHKLFLPWTKNDRHLRVTKKASSNEFGLGSRGAPLLGEGFLSRAIRTQFKDPSAATVSPEVGAHVAGGTATNAVDNQDTMPEASCPMTNLPEIYDVGDIMNHRLQWDSFTSLNQHFDQGKVVPSAIGENDELPAGRISAQHRRKTLLPRGNISGNAFHEIMETLCRNEECTGKAGFTVGNEPLEAAIADVGPLMTIVRRTMRKNALANQKLEDDSTERTLARMAWRALNTCIDIGGQKIFLKDVSFGNRLAEVEFVMDEASVLGADTPRLNGTTRDGAFNGMIDLLIRPDGKGGPVYVIDWKTNSLSGYGAESVAAAMEAAGYPLQFKLYSIAVARWLGRESLAGIAYLFVRGGEHGDKSGVYTRVMDDAMFADCRRSVLAAVPKGT